MALDTPNIGFLGSMSYQPNIDACLFLVTSIFPRIRKLRPDIHLYIIGRDPGRELIRQCRDPQIHITGEVENIWDYVRSVDAFVFPMLTGAGLQNKILEAMYAGKPVVTSTIGNAGIGATHGENVYIADTLDDYVKYTIDATSNDEIGKHASAFVRSNYSAKSVVGRYIQALESG
jgi:glycosyltransferase involved in cell wall biosynthesis